MKQLTAVILTTLVVLSGCTLNLSPPDAQIQISVSSSARALTADTLSWELSGNGPDGAVLDLTSLNFGANTIEGLVIGTWVLKLVGKDDAGDTVSQGGAVVDLQPGPNEVTMSMVSLGLVASAGTSPSGGVLITSGQVFEDSSLVTAVVGTDLADGLIVAYKSTLYTLRLTGFQGDGLTYTWILDGSVDAAQTGSTYLFGINSLTQGLHHINFVVTDSDGRVFSQEVTLDIMVMPS